MSNFSSIQKIIALVLIVLIFFAIFKLLETTLVSKVARPIALVIEEELETRGAEFDHVEVYQPRTIPSGSVFMGVLAKQEDLLVEGIVYETETKTLCFPFLAQVSYREGKWTIDNIRSRPGPMLPSCYE